ncbi:site-2 protease family protein [Acidovorax sp. NPDC077693]|uniref:site-2 protease family protein n=1 Tax=unclassified Acidovorax TaxID=2684926 RepID=UPI0037C63B3E
MERWTTLATAAALLLAAVPLWMWVAVARGLAALRMQQTQSTTVERAEVPAPYRAILDGAEAEAAALGFAYVYSLKSSPIAHISEMPWIYSDVYVSADGRSQLQVSPSNLPDAARPCVFQWVTVWEDGRPHDVTLHCYRHFLLWWPPTWQVHDDYVASVREAWQGHQRRVDAGCAAGRQSVTDIGKVRDAAIAWSQEMLPHGVAQGYLTPLPGALAAEPGSVGVPLWRIRWPAALRLAPALLRGVRRSGRVLSGHPAAAASTPPNAEVALQNDLQAFEQHQSHMAEVAARPRRKWLALGVTAALFMVVGGLLMSWRSALLVLVAIALHEGGHWWAMRRFGYRNLSVLFIPGLGGVAMGHKPEASTWNKLGVYLAGPMPGLFLGVALLLAVARGWLPGSGWVSDFAIMCLAINYLNLLPVHPLDGGRVVESLLFVRWPVLRFAFVLIGVFALAALAWFLGDAVTLALAGLLALGLAHHWRLMRVDQLVARPADGQALSERDAAARIFKATQHPRFSRWSFTQRLAAVRALLPEFQGARLGVGGTLAGLVIYAACLALPVVALVASGAASGWWPVRSAPKYPPDDVLKPSASHPAPDKALSITSEEWARRLARASEQPANQRLQTYLGAAGDALDMEDTQTALERYQQAWALAEDLPPATEPDRARAQLGLLRATSGPEAARAWGLRLLADVPAGAGPVLDALRAEAERDLAYNAPTVTAQIEHMQRALMHWEALAQGASDHAADPEGAAQQASYARSSLSRWHDQRGQPADVDEARLLLQRNVDAWEWPAPSDRSPDALRNRIRRTSAMLDLAWFALEHGQAETSRQIAQQVLTMIPARVTISWVHVQDRALETRVWADLSGQSTGELLESWKAWQSSARNTVQPRRDLVAQLDRWVVTHRLGLGGQADEARAHVLRDAERGGYWVERWCGPLGTGTAEAAQDVRERARRDAAQATGLCASASSAAVKSTVENR